MRLPAVLARSMALPLAVILASAAALAGCSAATGPAAHESAQAPAAPAAPATAASPAPETAPFSRETATEPVPESETPVAPPEIRTEPEEEGTAMTETATFATGCYWCSEAVFQRIPGVVKVRSGFTGGTVEDPPYELVCTGTTGHAEAVEVTFDPKKVSYETLLDWFWRMHDPTTLNRQGADEGTQYRSAVFWHSEAQRAAAEASKKAAQEAFRDPIVTEITKAGPFYEADAYHQNYYNTHSSQGYCRVVIAPKLHKLGLDEKK